MYDSSLPCSCLANATDASSGFLPDQQRGLLMRVFAVAKVQALCRFSTMLPESIPPAVAR